MNVLVALLIAVIVVAVLVGLVLTALYNGLVKGRNQCGTAFAGMETQLQRRHDLVPSVVETVKGAMAHERATLERLTHLRSIAHHSERGSSQHLAAEHELGQTLATVMARAEGYPELRTNENALHLQRLLTEIEEQLSASRRSYNASVESYNNKVESVPSNLIAVRAGFQQFAFFEAGPETRRPGNVGLDRR